jgi:hypothetical protein
VKLLERTLAEEKRRRMRRSRSLQKAKSADRLLWRPSFQGVREEYVIKPP